MAIWQRMQFQFNFKIDYKIGLYDYNRKINHKSQSQNQIKIMYIVSHQEISLISIEIYSLSHNSIYELQSLLFGDQSWTIHACRAYVYVFTLASFLNSNDVAIKYLIGITQMS